MGVHKNPIGYYRYKKSISKSISFTVLDKYQIFISSAVSRRLALINKSFHRGLHKVEENSSTLTCVSVALAFAHLQDS